MLIILFLVDSVDNYKKYDSPIIEIKKGRAKGKVTKDNSDLADESVVEISETYLPSTPEFSLMNEQSDSEANPNILHVMRSTKDFAKESIISNAMSKRQKYLLRHKSNSSMELIQRSLIKRKISTNARCSSPDSLDNDNQFKTNDDSQVIFKANNDKKKTTHEDLVFEVNRLNNIIHHKEIMHSNIIGIKFISLSLGELIQIKRENTELRKYLNYFMQMNNLP